MPFKIAPAGNFMSSPLHCGATRTLTQMHSVLTSPTNAADESFSTGATVTADPSMMDAETKASVRILVVDDEHTLRESCASVLRLEGYTVTVCGRADEAVNLFQRRGFDIV